MSGTFKEFQTGLQLGLGQRQQRKDEDTRARASALFDQGVYEGAESTLMRGGLVDDAAAVGAAGKRRMDAEAAKAKAEQMKAYGTAYGKGDMKGMTALRDTAGAAGDIDTVTKVNDEIAKMSKADRESASLRAEAFGQTAYGLSQIKDPAQRKAAFMEIVQTSGQAMGITPEQAAQMDLSDANLKLAYTRAMSIKDQLDQNAPDYELKEDANGNYVRIDTKGIADPSKTGVKAPPPKPGMTVNNIMSGENAYSKGLGETAAADSKGVSTAAQTARAQMAQVEQLDAFLGAVDYQGFGASALQKVKQAAQAVGIDVGDDVAAAQVADTIRKQLALSMKQDLPGPMSNADREFLLSIPANINNKPEANDALVYIMRKKAQMAIDMENSLLQARPASLEAFQAWQRDYLQRANSKPMFTAAERAELLADLSGR